jgi:hypothetical protein
MPPSQQFGHLLIGLHIRARHRCQAAITCNMVASTRSRRLPTCAKPSPRFLPKRADFAFQTFLDIDKQILDTVHLSIAFNNCTRNNYATLNSSLKPVVSVPLLVAMKQRKAVHRRGDLHGDLAEALHQHHVLHYARGGRAQTLISSKLLRCKWTGCAPSVWFRRSACSGGPFGGRARRCR